MDIAGDIIAACRNLKSVGEQPSMIRMSRDVYDSLRNPKWSPVKGASREKKRQRFRRRKISEWVELHLDTKSQTP